MDGTGSNRTASTQSINCALTTSDTDDIVEFILGTGSGSISNPSVSGGGLTWNLRKNIISSGVGLSETYWYAKAANPLSSVIFTATWTTSTNAVCMVFGVHSADQSTIFDTHSGVPTYNSSATTTVEPEVDNLTTTNPNDLILGIAIGSGSASYTEIGGFTISVSVSGGPNGGEESLVVSSAQTNKLVAMTASGSIKFIIIADAIEQAAQNTYYFGTTQQGYYYHLDSHIATVNTVSTSGNLINNSYLWGGGHVFSGRTISVDFFLNPPYSSAQTLNGILRTYFYMNANSSSVTGYYETKLDQITYAGVTTVIASSSNATITLPTGSGSAPFTSFESDITLSSYSLPSGATLETILLVEVASGHLVYSCIDSSANCPSSLTIPISTYSCYLKCQSLVTTTTTADTGTSVKIGTTAGDYPIEPDIASSTTTGSESVSFPSGYGWETAGSLNDNISSGNWIFIFDAGASSATGTARIWVSIFSCASTASISCTFLFKNWDNTTNILSTTTTTAYTYEVSEGAFNNVQTLVVEAWIHYPSAGSSSSSTVTFTTASEASSVGMPAYTADSIATLPILCTTVEAGAPKPTLALSGGALTPSPKSIPCDGVTYNVVVSASATITATEPANGNYGANTLYTFSGASSTINNAACSSGTCSVWGFTNYYQATEQFAYAVVDGGSPTAPTLTYTSDGNGATTYTVTTSLAPVNLDYGTTWALTNPLIGSGASERWDATTGTSGTASAGGSQTTSYYNQWSFKLSYIIVDGGSPTAPVLTTTQFGASYTPSLTGSQTQYWPDAGQPWSVTNPLIGSGSTERWYTNQVPISGTVGSIEVIQYSYYHQLNNTYQATPNNPTTFSGGITFTISGTVYGAPATICTITIPSSPSSGPYSCSGYADYDIATTFPSSSGHNPAPNIVWIPITGSTLSYSDTTGGNTHSVSYKESFTAVVYFFNPTDPTTFTKSIVFTVTGTVNGTGATLCSVTIPSNPSSGSYSCSGAPDYGTTSTATRVVNISSSVRWYASSSYSFTEAGAANHTINYVEQLYLTFGGCQSCTADVTSLGSPVALTSSGYFDYNTAIAVAGVLQHTFSNVVYPAFLYQVPNGNMGGLQMITNSSCTTNFSPNQESIFFTCSNIEARISIPAAYSPNAYFSGGVSTPFTYSASTNEMSLAGSGPNQEVDFLYHCTQNCIGGVGTQTTQTTSSGSQEGAPIIYSIIYSISVNASSATTLGNVSLQIDNSGYYIWSLRGLNFAPPQGLSTTTDSALPLSIGSKSTTQVPVTIGIAMGLPSGTYTILGTATFYQGNTGVISHVTFKITLTLGPITPMLTPQQKFASFLAGNFDGIIIIVVIALLLVGTVIMVKRRSNN